MTYISDIPELMIDWDTERNKEAGADAAKTSASYTKKVYWKCHVCGGQWSTAPKYRRGCPYCTNFKALPGFNDLATLYPELAEEWDYEKNMDLKPTQITKGSAKKVWWVCQKGHSYRQSVTSRTHGEGCPVCNNKQVLKGYNDLQTIWPEIASSWDYEKNSPLKPDEVISGSKKKYWWKCGKGHEWLSSVADRCRGKGCPVCMNRRIIAGINDLVTVEPKIAQEWNYSKNDTRPEQYSIGSRKIVWWKCKRGHSWKAAIADRGRGYGCPKCAQERRVSFPEKAILYYVMKRYPDAKANCSPNWLGKQELDIFIPSLKIAVEYDGVYGHSRQAGNKRDLKKNALCKNNNVTLIRIREEGCLPLDGNSIDYQLKESSGLPYAIQFVIEQIEKVSGRKTGFDISNVNIERDSGDIYSLIEYSDKENSLAVRNPDVAALWHPTKNGTLTPELVLAASSKMVWWKGQCGHEWRSSIVYEASSGKCPYCSGKRILKGFNDLASQRTDITAEWDIEKNYKVDPYNIVSGYGKPVWWKCKMCGTEWQATVITRTRKKSTGCPSCGRKKQAIARQKTILRNGVKPLSISNPDIAAEWNYEKNDGVTPDFITAGSGKKLWWKCGRCGFEWQAVVYERTRGHCGCLKCKERKSNK